MAKESSSLIEKIIPSAVAVVCTAAICITGAVCTGKAVKKDDCADTQAVSLSQENENAYLTEAQAAAYIGIDEAHMVVMRKNLKKFEGAYIAYAYVKDGKEVEVVMYQKAKLDEAMKNLMKDNDALNFKYIDEALAKQNAAK